MNGELITLFQEIGQIKEDVAVIRERTESTIIVNIPPKVLMSGVVIIVLGLLGLDATNSMI